MLDEKLLYGETQACAQDFAQGGATAKRDPGIRGPEARGPKVSPVKNRKFCGFGPLFLVGAHSPFNFVIFYYIIFYFFRSGRGLGPRGPTLGYVPG